MKTEIQFSDGPVTIDLSKPMDISIPLRAGPENVNAWYVPPVSIEPVRTERFTGSVAEGGVVNFRNIAFNPHGNGTHTECVGHIAEEVYSVNDCFDRYFFKALLVSIQPEQNGREAEWEASDDLVITLKQVQDALGAERPEALVIRTLPNSTIKQDHQYNNTNPPYMHAEAMVWLKEIGVQHFLIDLPSVDRELDGGKMLAHRAWWNYPEAPRMDATITELVFVPNDITDGQYILELQLASFVNDASPSKPVLYRCFP